jgi:hypothetical protein
MRIVGLVLFASFVLGVDPGLADPPPKKGGPRVEPTPKRREAPRAGQREAQPNELIIPVVDFPRGTPERVSRFDLRVEPDERPPLARTAVSLRKRRSAEGPRPSFLGHDTHLGRVRWSGDRAVLDLPTATGATRSVSVFAVANEPGTAARTRPRRLVLVEHGIDARSSLELARDLATRDRDDQPLGARLARDPVLFTRDPERARDNLKRFDALDAAQLRDITVIRGERLEGLGDAKNVLIVARNSEALRANIEKASKDGLLAGKQVAVVTCGDVTTQVAALRETMFRGGAIRVWASEHQLSVDFARKFEAALVDTLAGTLLYSYGWITAPSLETLVRLTIARMKARGDSDAELQWLESARTFTTLFARPPGRATT